MPGVPNPPGTPNSNQLNPNQTPAPVFPAGQVGTTIGSGTSSNLFPKLQDWQAALGAYLVLIYMAEVPTLAPFAVAIAWGFAITYAIATNVPQEIINAVNNTSTTNTSAVNAGAQAGTATSTIGAPVTNTGSTGEIIPATPGG